MDEKYLTLLKFALDMCETFMDNANKTYEVCGYSTNDFYYLREELAKALGVSYNDLTD